VFSVGGGLGRSVLAFRARGDDIAVFWVWGRLVSTWALKHQEHSGAHEDLVKNVHIVIGNDYALAA